MMKSLNNILRENYFIVPKRISAKQGGWASLAYEIEDNNGNFFFLKVYEKNRKSIQNLLEHIDIYLPIVNWLYDNTPLKGKIIRLIKTQNQDYKCEDTGYVYILFDYIKGVTVGERLLTEEQVVNLADIVSQLHQVKSGFAVSNKRIYETFQTPFISNLYEWVKNKFHQLKPELQIILNPKVPSIINRIEELNHLSENIKRQNLVFNLCHTDIHHWNIIVQNKKLFLLDWEGVKFAPPEADLFGIYEQPYFDLFLERYGIHHPDYQLNLTAIQYYLISRRLQDIFEFIEQLQFDELNRHEYEINLNHLREQINDIDK